jgi:hypothetical protein
MGLAEDLFGFALEGLQQAGEKARQSTEDSARMGRQIVSGEATPEDLSKSIGEVSNYVPLAGGLKKLTEYEGNALKNLIQEKAASGNLMFRGLFRPMLEGPAGQKYLGGVGGSHGELYSQIRGPVNVQNYMHGYATPEGIPVPPEAYHALTSSHDLLRRAAESLKKGISLEAILDAIR